MGKTPKPLTIIAGTHVFEWPEVQALREQGHEVICVDWHDVFPELEGDPDILLAPYASRMDESLRKWLPEAIQEARRRKYPPGKIKGK